MIITNDVTSNDTIRDIVPLDSDRCYTFHSCRSQTFHLISYMSIHQVWPVRRLHITPILMNNTYAKERNLIFTIFQLVNRINEILTIKKYQTQHQIRAIQRLKTPNLSSSTLKALCSMLNPLLIAFSTE